MAAGPKIPLHQQKIKTRIKDGPAYYQNAKETKSFESLDINFHEYINGKIQGSFFGGSTHNRHCGYLAPDSDAI